MALATSLGIPGFMGISLSMLALLKLMDLDAFAEGFAKYDLGTRRFKPYGKVYPFAELAIGLRFLPGNGYRLAVSRRQRGDVRVQSRLYRQLNKKAIAGDQPQTAISPNFISIS